MAVSLAGAAGRSVGELPPLNHKQEMFVAAYLELGNSAKAYARAYPGISYDIASSAGTRLLRDVRVQHELAKARAMFKHGKVLSLAQIQAFLHDVVTTPVSQVTADSPLCQESNPTEWGVKIKMPDKHAAAMSSAKLSGHLIERVDNTHTMMPMHSVLSGLMGSQAETVEALDAPEPIEDAPGSPLDDVW